MARTFYFSDITKYINHFRYFGYPPYQYYTIGASYDGGWGGWHDGLHDPSETIDWVDYSLLLRDGVASGPPVMAEEYKYVYVLNDPSDIPTKTTIMTSDITVWGTFTGIPQRTYRNDGGSFSDNYSYQSVDYQYNLQFGCHNLSKRSESEWMAKGYDTSTFDLFCEDVAYFVNRNVPENDFQHTNILICYKQDGERIYINQNPYPYEAPLNLSGDNYYNFWIYRGNDPAAIKVYTI